MPTLNNTINNVSQEWKLVMGPQVPAGADSPFGCTWFDLSSFVVPVITFLARGFHQADRTKDPEGTIRTHWGGYGRCVSVSTTCS